MPFVELACHPVGVLADQGFDFAERGAQRRADGESAPVDGQADGAPPGAAQAVVDETLAEGDAAQRFARAQRAPDVG